MLQLFIYSTEWSTVLIFKLKFTKFFSLKLTNRSNRLHTHTLLIIFTTSYSLYSASLPLIPKSPLNTICTDNQKYTEQKRVAGFKPKHLSNKSTQKSNLNFFGFIFTQSNLFTSLISSTHPPSIGFILPHR